MYEQDNILMLKRLAAKIVGGTTTADTVPGETIADVIDIIQQHYTSGGAGVTVESATMNVDGAGAFDNGFIEMSDGSIVNIAVVEIPTLTVTSAEGSGIAKTIITVAEPLLEGDQYRYKMGTAIKPAVNQDVSTWIAWDGTSEITADIGTRLTLVECTESNLAVRCGSCEVVSPMF